MRTKAVARSKKKLLAAKINKKQEKKNKRKERKPHRWKPGTAALREIKKAQSSTGNKGLTKASMSRLVREIAQDIVIEHYGINSGFRFTKNSEKALKVASEEFLTDSLALANVMAIHGEKRTVKVKDLKLASSLMMNMHVLKENKGIEKIFKGVDTNGRKKKTEKLALPLEQKVVDNKEKSLEEETTPKKDSETFATPAPSDVDDDEEEADDDNNDVDEVMEKENDDEE